jgi:hypothetical protein
VTRGASIEPASGESIGTSGPIALEEIKAFVQRHHAAGLTAATALLLATEDHRIARDAFLRAEPTSASPAGNAVSAPAAGPLAGPRLANARALLRSADAGDPVGFLTTFESVPDPGRPRAGQRAGCRIPAEHPSPGKQPCDGAGTFAGCADGTGALQPRQEHNRN